MKHNNRSAIFTINRDCCYETDLCKEIKNKWFLWFIRVGNAKTNHSIREEILISQVPLAILDCEQSQNSYLTEIGPKSRNMLRKAERNQLFGREFISTNYLSDIWEIWNSKPTRQGKPMSDTYLGFPSRMEIENDCNEHYNLLYGIFAEEKLVAYANIMILGELAIYNQIIGHGSFLPLGTMNALVFHSREHLRQRGLRGLNYLKVGVSTVGLDGFKTRVGFRSTFTTLRSIQC